MKREKIEINCKNKTGVITVKIDGQLAAEMTFVLEDTKEMVINHTQVHSGYEGRGYGKMLVARAVDFARENHLSISPLCAYAHKVLAETPAYHDVLQTGEPKRKGFSVQ